MGQLKLRNILVPLINIHFVAVTNPIEFWQHPQFSTLLTHPSHNVSHCILRHNCSCIPPHSKLGRMTRHFYKDSLCKVSANLIEKAAPLWLVRQFLNWIFIVVSLAKTLGVNCGVTGMPLISTLLIIGVHQFSSQFEINITDLYMFWKCANCVGKRVIKN